MALPVLELQNVDVRLGSTEVFRELSLRIDKGSRTVLIGPSGQGKSTLLKCLAGLIRPTKGRFLVNGEDFHNLPARRQQEIRLQMGMLFQKNALFDSMKNIDNIRFPLEQTSGHGKNAEENAEKRINEIAFSYLEAVGLSHAAELYPDEISGGMQKRLGIARALALQPEIVFYDDPTAGLDPITSRKIVDLILDLQKKASSTMLAVTNDMNRAFQMADRIFMILDKGALETGTPDETRQHADLRVQQFIKGRSQGLLTVLE